MSCVACALPGDVIKQGDSLTCELGLDGLSDVSGWTCRVVIAPSAGAAPVFSADVTQTDEAGGLFILFVPGTDTVTWPARDYLIMTRIRNAGSGESDEFHAELRVEPRGVVS